jgi:hypothetical protein
VAESEPPPLMLGSSTLSVNQKRLSGFNSKPVLMNFKTVLFISRSQTVCGEMMSLSKDEQSVYLSCKYLYRA